jgi:small multidrug resistance family-3 protein
MHDLPRTLALFAITAVAEIVGCYLPLLWLSGRARAWVLLPACASLALFVWLLTLHPTASGRVYATYGAVYIATALLWLRVVDGVALNWSDWSGAALALAGAALIIGFQRS